MNVETACEAIEAILAAIPDDELPEFDRVEKGADGRLTVWWGGSGRVLGSATSGGERDPAVYRRNAARAAIEEEMAYRADLALFANGDDPTGVVIRVKRRSR